LIKYSIISNKIPLLYCNDSNYIIGGVEMFNRNLEFAFEENNLQYKTVYKVNHLNKFAIIREIVSLIKLIVISRKLRYDYLLLHHSNFFSILILPFLSIFFSDIKTLCHVGTEWKHIKNSGLRKFTIYFLKKYTKKCFVISDTQISFLKDVDVEKINSIIARGFINIPINKKEKTDDYILFLARVCREKGIYDILNLYKKNYENLPKIKICGPIIDDKTRDFINSTIEKCKNKIELLDPVYDIEEKIQLIDKSIFGIYPSYYDAFPLTPIEFFSRGKMCITSNISESVNFIKDINLLITPGDVKQMEMSISYALEIIKNKTYQSEISLTINTAKEIAEGKIVNILTK